MECMCNNCFECPYPDCIISNKEMMRRERTASKLRKQNKKKIKKVVENYSVRGTVSIPEGGGIWNREQVCLT